MKKIILMTFAILSCGIANAQNQPEVKKDKNIEITPQIGLSSSNYYSGDTKLNNSAISGLNIGVGLDYYFNDRWSLRSGLFYQKMGSTYSESSFKTSKDELFYLTIPINANWHFGSTRKWNLNFGPSVGFLTSAQNQKGGDLNQGGAYYNKTDVGLTFENGFLFTDLERTLIDIAIRPAYSGGVFEVLEAFEIAKEKIDVYKLNKYLEILNYIYPYHQLIGFYMDKAGYDEKTLDVFNKKSDFDFYLTYNISNKEYNKKWKIYYPKGF